MPDPLPTSSPPRPRRPLFRKYFAFLSLLVAGSLAINGTVEMYFGYREHREALMRLQKQRAEAAALQIEGFVDDIVRALVLTSQSPEIQLEGITPRFRRSLFVLLRNHPAIMEATVLDQNGRRSLQHSRLRITTSQDREDHSTLPPFSTAISGETYFSPVYFNFGSEPFLTVAVPITNLEGDRLGVLSAEVNLKYIRDLVSEIRIGQAGFAYVVERGGDLIAHPDLALVLQKKNLNAIPQVRDFMDVPRAPGTPAGPQSVLGRNSRGEKVLSSYTLIPQLGWGVFVEQPLREAFDPLYSSLTRTGAILLSVLLLALLMAFTLTRAIVRPIEALKRGVSRIGQGHLAEPIEVQRADEIGDLATAFNEMASAVLSSRQKLEEHGRTLEQRVADRTRELSTLLETARYAVSTLTQDEIFPMILQSAAKLLDCHASTFRLLDPETKILRLAADYNLLDEEFKGRGDIALGEGCMGRVAVEGRPMTVEDVETDPFYHHKEKALRAGIRSIAIVPVRVHGAVTGVLSVYDSRRRRFSDEEVSSLTEFANLASLALEKTRLYGEILKGKEHLGTILEINKKIGTTTQVSELLQTIADEAARLLQVDGVGFRLVEGDSLVIGALTGVARDVMLSPRLKIGESLSGQVAAENRPIVVPDIAAATSWRKEHREAALRTGIKGLMIVPVPIGGRVIGTLNIYTKASRHFTQRDLDVATAFADQAAIALENARLYQETLRGKEHLGTILEINKKIGTTTQVSDLLQTIDDEAARLLQLDGVGFRLVEGDSLVIGARSGVASQIMLSPRLKIGESLSGQAVAENRPIIVPDIAAATSWRKEHREAALRAGVTSAMFVPVAIGDRVIGAFNMYTKARRQFTQRDLVVAMAFADQAAIALENARLHQETLRGKEHLGTILEINKKIGTTTQVSELLQAIADEAARLLQVDGAGFRLVEGDFLVIGALSGVAREIMLSPRLKIGESVSGQAAAEIRPIILPDITTATSWRKEHREAALRAGVTSAMTVPVRIGDRVIGILAIHAKARRHFTQRDLDVAMAFADQAAIAIENARLYAEAERRRRAAESLAALGQLISQSLDPEEIGQQVVTSVTELLGAITATLFRQEPESGDLVSVALAGDAALVLGQNPIFPRGTGAAGLAALERRPVVTANLLADPQITLTPELRARIEQATYRSVIAVPLIVKDRVIGALGIGDRPGRVFTTEEIRLTQTFADQAAIALEKAWLHQETIRQHQELAQRNRELQALFTVTNTVTRSLDIASIMQAALLTTIEVLHVDAGRLYIFDEKSHVLRLTAHHGLPPDVLKDYASYAPGQGIIGTIFQESRPIVFSDFANDPNHAAMTRSRLGIRLGFRSAAGLPILVQGRPVGVIYLFGRAVREFTPEDLALLSAIGAQIGIAIENARLYSSLEEYSRNLEERVRERTQELEIANQHKSEFLATMSHELRTPLNAVIGFSELLTSQLGSSLSDRHKRYLKNIHVSGHHLLDLINGILDLAKVESGKMDLQYEEVPFPELIQQVLAGVQPQAEAKALTLSREIEGGLDRVTLDAGKVKQILYNLLGNAVKFTPDGGQVTVTARVAPGSRQRDCLEISVTDTGIGIKPEDQGRIFEPFQQIESSLARKYPGTGLGLALTKKLVELHGGRIRVESTPGRGSTFTFTLALPSPVLLPREGGEVSAETPEVEQREERVEDDPDRPLILVVEDDPKAIDLLSTYLREGGYRVAVARSSQETLTKAKALRPLAVTLDILFPTEDGWQILQNLKTDPETRDIPVLIVSILDDRPRGLQMGAVDYMVKPVTRELLLAGLARLGIASPRLRGMQVLAIDDDPGVLELLGATLEGEGLSLLTAPDGPEGIRLARTKKPDFIILDLMMPGMSGFEVVQHLRTDPATSGIPIFICSGKTLTAQERELLAKQVEGVIQKGSFLPKDILQMIAEVRNRLRPAPSSR